MHNLTLAVADTEYEFPLPHCVRFEFHARVVDDPIRFAFVTGFVAAPADPHFTLHGGTEYYSYPLDWRPSTVPGPLVLYFASGTAGAVVENITWN